MKVIAYLKLAIVCCIVGATLRVAAAQEFLTVAVLNFEARETPIKELGPQIATLLNATLSAEPNLIMVERAELDKLLSEQELGLSGTVSADTAARVGYLTGAKVLVTGRIFRADKETVIVAKIISTETSRVYGEIVKSASKPVTELADELAKKISQTATEKSDTLVAKIKTRPERIENIKKNLRRDERPVAFVKIPEQHFGNPTIDPAAETEFGLLLKESGFPLVTATSDTKPEIEFVGEAFSELGMRKGNLISCHARVEIKVIEKATGKILAVDRQTSVAVDLSEQIAAKTALQNAAAELAERVIPKAFKK